MQVSKKPNRCFENDGKSTIKERTLRKKIGELEREIVRLKNQLKTADEAFKLSAKFMSTKTKQLSTLDLINAAKSNMTLEETIGESGCFCKNVNCVKPDVFKGSSMAGMIHICRTCKTRWVEKEIGDVEKEEKDI